MFILFKQMCCITKIIPLFCNMHVPDAFISICQSNSITQLLHAHVKTFITAQRVCIACIYRGKMSVCLSHTGIVSKPIQISSIFFHHRVAPPFQFFHTKRGGNISRASNARGYDKMTIFAQISCYISETVIVIWAHAARQFVSIEFSFHPYNI